MPTGSQASFPFALIAIDHPTANRVYWIIRENLLQGWNDPPIRYLAERIGRCRRQVQRALAFLVETGRLLIHRRRLTRDRNATNVYEIPGLGGEGDIFVQEKQKQKQIPSTPAPPAPTPAIEVLKSHNARLERLVTFYRRWIDRGAQIHQARGWRKNRDLQAMRMQQQAMVGTPEAFRLAHFYADMEKEVFRWN